MGPRSKSQQWNGSKHVTQKLLAGNCWDLIGIAVTILLKVIWSFWHFDLDLWPWDIFVFFNSSSKFWMPYASSLLFSLSIYFSLIVWKCYWNNGLFSLCLTYSHLSFCDWKSAWLMFHLVTVLWECPLLVQLCMYSLPTILSSELQK